MTSSDRAVVVASRRFSAATPFEGEQALRFLAARAVQGLEEVSAAGYARTLRLPGGPGAVRLRLEPDAVRVDLEVASAGDVDRVALLCRRMLDLDADPSEILACLGDDPLIGPSVRARPGMRIVGHPDGFEVAVRAIVGQQVSVAGARTVLGRLVAEYGEAVETASPGLTRLFPAPETLAAVDPSRLPMPASRGRALVSVSQEVADGVLALDRSAPIPEVRAQLLAIPGVGPWTADYIALRALGDRDVFLPTDLGVRHGLAKLGATGPVSDLAARWAPLRSYALMHVWAALEGDPT